jgi:hypothetical protein
MKTKFVQGSRKRIEDEEVEDRDSNKVELE